MTKLPELKFSTIRGGELSEEVRDFESARYIFVADAIILVEGYRTNSYEELLELASRNEYRGREFLEVVILPLEVAAGG